MSIITDRPGDQSGRLGHRLLWFAGLYLAGVALTAGVAALLRAVLLPGH